MEDERRQHRQSDELRDYRIEQLEKRQDAQEVRVTSIERWQSAVESAAKAKVTETADPSMSKSNQRWVQIIITILTILLAMITYLKGH